MMRDIRKEESAIFFRTPLILLTGILVISASKQLFASNLPIEFSEVAPGVFLHLGRQEEMQLDNLGDIANIGFIVGSRSVAVIDTGGSPQIGRAIRRSIETVTRLPISHVILTHVHPDHIFGASAFGDIPQVVAHRNFSRALLQRGNFYRERFEPLLGDATIHAYLNATMAVENQIQLDLGNRLLTIRAHKTAHTDHDLSIFDESSKTLWAADLIFTGRIPSLDGSLPGWLKVMDALAALKPALVIPGHGRPGDWQTVSTPQYRYLRNLLTQTRTLLAGNIRLSDALEMITENDSDNWALYESYHPGNVTKAFTELEWE